MSYILDALRRADAEREGAAMQGGFGQPLVADADDTELPPPVSPWLWMAAGMLVVVLVGVLWRWWTADSEPMPVAPVAVVAPEVMPAPPPTEGAPAAATAAQPAPQYAPPDNPPQAPAAPQEAARPLPIDDPRQPASRGMQRDTARPARKPAPTAEPADAVPPLRSTAPAERPAAAEPRIYQLTELPEDIRRQVPRLAMGGAMYSDKPASRMLIVNGQLFHEGDQLAPSLSLRQIRLKSAVLEFMGYRYEVSY
jgi:general secretion pathway protein B